MHEGCCWSDVDRQLRAGESGSRSSSVATVAGPLLAGRDGCWGCGSESASRELTASAGGARPDSDGVDVITACSGAVVVTGAARGGSGARSAGSGELRKMGAGLLLLLDGADGSLSE